MYPLKTVRPACHNLQYGPRGFDQLGSDRPPHTPASNRNQQPLIPWPYQTVLMDDIRAKYRSTALRVLLQLPTGGGKTFVFCRIAAGAFAKGRRVWLLGHRAEIIEQISGALYMLGIEHGVLEGGQGDANSRIIVASIATMARRLDRYKDAPPDLIVVDEAHHAVAGSWRKILNAFPKARILGVTATAERLDGRGLGDVFETMISCCGRRKAWGYIFKWSAAPCAARQAKTVRSFSIMPGIHCATACPLIRGNGRSKANRGNSVVRPKSDAFGTAKSAARSTPSAQCAVSVAAPS
jgi:hypothetical protein